MTYKMNGMVLSEKEVKQKKKVLGLYNQMHNTNFTLESLGITTIDCQLNNAKRTNRVLFGYGGGR